MTKRHFIALADTLRVLRNRLNNDDRHRDTSTTSDQIAGGRMMLQAVIAELADFCASQNSRFDRDRWLAYVAGECGPNGGKR